MAVTRIKNNQITDSTIVGSSKLQDYSISAAKIANNLTYGSDLTVTGNLTVQGNVTAVDTVNLVVEDPIIILAANQTGNASVDIGFIGERGTSTNIAFVWDESEGKFVTVFTNDTESNSIVTIASYASFKTLDAVVTGNLAVTGTTTLTGNASIGNIAVLATKTIDLGLNVVGNVAEPVGNADAATKGYVDGFVSGGITIEDDTANTTSLALDGTLELLGTVNEVTVAITAADQVTFGLPDSVTITANLSAGNLSATGALAVTGNATVGNLSSAGLATFTGNVTSGNLITAGLVQGATVTATGNITAGNANITSAVNSATVNATGNITGGNISAGAGIIATTGNVNGGNLNSNNLIGTAVTITSTGNLNLAPTGNISLNSRYINGLNQPVQDNDAASKIYVDNMVSTQLAYHTAVVAATTGTLATATGGAITYNNGTAGVGATLTTTGTFTTIDTANVATAGTRILVKDQADATQNGVYEYTSATVITRTTDADTYGPNSSTDLSVNDYFFVSGGNVNKGSAYICDAPSGVITFGTSNITFAQFSSSQTYTANTAAGIVINGTVFSTKVDNISTGFDVGGNIVVKESAVLVTPNIGAATGTSLTVTGNVLAGNLNSNAAVTGVTMTATGNITGGNLITAGLGSFGTTVTATGNITGGNLTTAGLTSTNDLFVSGFANIVGNANFGNLSSTGVVNATGNITGGNLLTGGQLNVTGNITGGNIFTPGHLDATTITAISNIVGGNINTGGQVVATGNVIAGNIETAGQANLGNIRISGDTITGTNGQVLVNSALADVNFVVSGDTQANLLFVDAGTDTVLINTGTPTTGATVKIGGTNSIIIPVGTTGERPTGATGMVRFNTSLNNLEFYDSDSWETAGSQFTVIAANVQNGDGTQVAFTLPQIGTTAGTIVAINGVMQIPVTAYSVTGNVCTFTEAPLSTDVIDFRQLTTTSEVGAIAGSGGGQVEASATLNQIDLTGNIIPVANVTYSLGNLTNRFNDLYLSGTSIYLGNVIMQTATGNTIAFYQPDGVTPATIAASSVDTTQIASGTSSVSVISSGGNVRANVAGATVQVLSSAGANVTGYITATGNITGNYILGNGSQLQGIITSVASMSNGTSNVSIETSGGNVTTGVAGTPNVVIVTATGANIAGTLNATGNANVGNIGATNVVATNLTGTLTTAAQTNITSVGTLSALSVAGNISPGGISMSAGNATIGNLYVSGTTTIAGNIQQVSGNSGQFFGNATTGFNALYAGLPAGFTLLPQSVTNFVSTINGYSQINNQNQNGGNEATVDYILTSNNGSDSTFYVDLGMASSGYDGAVAVLNNALGNSVAANDGYLYVTGNVAAANPSDFVIATPDTGAQIRFAVGGSNVANVSVKVNAPNTAATSGTTGTLNVLGGISTSGVVWVASDVTLGGNIVDTGALTISTGSNGNITLAPDGTGVIIASKDLINGQANGTGNIGNATGYFNTVFAKATSAQYADLAEKYVADAEYAPGTVLEFGGDAEVTLSTQAGSTRVAGVVSTNPSYIMNATLEAEHVAMVALQGRVPCRVVGTVRKGDMMVAAGNGAARVDNTARAGTIIGKALENFDGAEGTIEVVVGRN